MQLIFNCLFFLNLFFENELCTVYNHINNTQQSIYTRRKTFMQWYDNVNNNCIIFEKTTYKRNLIKDRITPPPLQKNPKKDKYCIFLCN